MTGTNSRCVRWRPVSARHLSDIDVGLMTRVDALRAALTADGRAEAMVVSDPSNIRWLCGFTGSSGSVVVTSGRVVLVTDGRYTDQARRQLDEVGL